ncbi:MAG: methyltransferase domain-containing protein, partial [Acidimicrobiales bacterium]
MSEPSSSDASLWETHADWWQAEFTDGVDPEYEEQILPLAAEHLAGVQQLVDIGTGEGQVARLAAALGCGVIGFDPTWAQVSEAQRRGRGPSYAQAAASAMP